jgi:DNA polymerase-3 subunit delta
MNKELSYNEIKGSIQSRKFVPVYLFQGEESYYIDQLTNLLMELVLYESERDFNQTVFYGSETNVSTVISACRRYPMMAERQLIIVKEAQRLKNIEELVYYVKNPLKTTILVVNYKYGKLDGRKKLINEIEKEGIVFESKKIYENKIPDFIVGYLREKQAGISISTAQILTDYLGADLNKIAHELDKLLIVLPSGQKQITTEMVEKNIGISKDFNNYELQKAVARRDILKANRIAIYFEHNPKANPFAFTLTTLFGFFANLMICHYEKDRSKSNLMRVLGFKWDIQIADYMEALKIYNPMKTMKNVSLIREYDAKGKGIDNNSTSPSKLLIELLYKLMH